jgi:hypothetical protein
MGYFRYILSPIGAKEIIVLYITIFHNNFETYAYMFVHILSLMQFLRLDMLMFTCTDCIFSFYYRIRLFWSKTGNDTAIYGYILLMVIPQGNLIIKDAEFLV